MTITRMLRFCTAILAVYLLLPSISGAAENPLKPTLVELMTPVCPACKEMAKVLAEFEEKHGGSVEVKVIDVREDANAARLYQVRYVPTLVFLDEEGKELEKKVGYMPLDALEKEWERLGYSLNATERAPQ